MLATVEPMSTRGRIRFWKDAGVALFVFLVDFSYRSIGADWPQYRGASHDGISIDRITKQWSGAVTNPMWLVRATNCLGSFAVSGGRAFTQTRRAVTGTSMEVCVALNATTGAELWATPVDIASYPHGGVGFDDGPRSTPGVAENSVFVLSSYLKLYRLNATNGAIMWQKDLRSIYGGDVIGWQNTASPLLDDGLIFVNANCGTSTLMALRTSDGEPAWRSQDEAMTHSTPVLTTIHGVRQVIFATQRGLVSLNPQSGDLLWRISYPFRYSTCIGVSPVVSEDMVFVCGAHSYQMGSVVIQATVSDNTWTATQLWWTNNPAGHWMTPVAHQGFLYGMLGIQQFDSVNAQLKCIDMRTGTVMWSTNGFGRGGTILVDGHLLTITERGQLVLSELNTNAYIEVARLPAIPNYHGSSNKCWNVPAVCDGRVYVRSTAYAACYDLSVAGLQLDPPQPVGGDGFSLTVRTANGTAMDSNRLAGLEVRTSTNLTQNLNEWLQLTNSPLLTNGVVRIDNVGSGGQPQRFFIVSEPE